MESWLNNIFFSGIARFDILGVQMSATTLDGACECIDRMIQEKRKGYVCVCPVSTIMAAQDDEAFRKIVNSADIVTTDGMPTVWIGRRRGYKHISRVYGPDLMLKVCEMSVPKGYRHFFYGATDPVLAKLKEKLTERFPGINIGGMYSPPFKELTLEEDKEIVNMINRVSPDIIWVGLGSPKQDRWIFAHKDRLNAAVSLAVGAAFDFLSGSKPQAPQWMQKTGLEWLFRLCCEPKRLWKRYLLGNTRFIFLLILNSFNTKKALPHV